MKLFKGISILLAVLVFLSISAYPFVVFQLDGRLGFTSEKVDNIFHWSLFILWSASLWVFGFVYNRLSTADIKMFIIALMCIVATGILFNDVATHFFGYGNGEERIIYTNKTNERMVILQRFHGAGAIGSDYYDTIYIYQITKWVRYEEEFESDKFGSTQWVNFTSTQK